MPAINLRFDLHVGPQATSWPPVWQGCSLAAAEEPQLSCGGLQADFTFLGPGAAKRRSKEAPQDRVKLAPCFYLILC